MKDGGKSNIPLVTVSLVVINVVFFLVCDLFLFRQQYKIVYHMALNPALVTEEGQYWRLFTSMFYHFDMEHVMFNMLSLLVLGVILEPFFGRIRFLIVYFVSGLLADVAVIVYNSIIVSDKAAEVFAAGASGAVYGLFGAFAGMMLCFRRRFCKKETVRLLLMVLLLLFGNLSQEGVGHEAHFGGFFAGAVMGIGYCLYIKNRMKKIEERKNHYGGDI